MTAFYIHILTHKANGIVVFPLKQFYKLDVINLSNIHLVPISFECPILFTGLLWFIYFLCCNDVIFNKG